MDSSVSPKDEIWFLRVCHHISDTVYLYWCSSGYTGRGTYKGDVNFRPPPVAAFKIIPIFVHEINSWLSSQPKGISVFVHACYSCLHPVNKNSSYAAAKSYFVISSDTTLFLPLSTSMFSQSGSITVFLTDPCSDLLRSLFLAVFLLILDSDMQAATTISWPFTCSCTVFGVLASPLHIPVWASTRSMLSRGPNFELTKYFVSRSQQLTTNECESVEITNKMQPCNRIYYFKLYLQPLVYIHML